MNNLMQSSIFNLTYISTRHFDLTLGLLKTYHRQDRGKLPRKYCPNFTTKIVLSYYDMRVRYVLSEYNRA